jgi:hypothetical protein
VLCHPKGVVKEKSWKGLQKEGSEAEHQKFVTTTNLLIIDIFTYLPDYAHTFHLKI